jgi:uncharacterized protein (TIGR02001 family)
MKKSTLLKIQLGSFGLTSMVVLFQLDAPVMAQEFSVGADFVSRYVWRGTDYGEAASIQPVLSFSTSGFEIGSWASYSLSPDAAGVNEHDLWLGYTVETAGSGTVAVGVTDYYFPSPDGAGFFEFDGDGNGAHWIEPFASYTAPKPLPVTLMGAIFAHNDPDNSVYLEASAPIQVDGVMLGLTAGMVAGKSDLYGTDGPAIVNLGISASREIPITEQFSLPISVTYVLNPDAERSFLVFGITL